MHARALHCHEELEHIPTRQVELAEAQVVRLQYGREEVVKADMFVVILLLVRMTTSS